MFATSECHCVKQILIIFFRRWFPYYLRKPVLSQIYSTLTRYYLYFSRIKFVSKRYKIVWTVDYEYVNIMDQELVSFIKKNADAIKAAMLMPGIYNINIYCIT